MNINKEKGFKIECFSMRILEEKGSTFIEFEEFLIFNEFGWGEGREERVREERAREEILIVKILSARLSKFVLGLAGQC